MSKQQYKQEGFESLAKEQLLYPQEQLAMVKKDRKKLTIGIPREKSSNEKRVALRPEAVEILVNNGHEFIVETQAGEGGKFTDQQYSEAGAMIVYSDKEIYECDIIIKIEPPTLEEVEYMKPGTTIISALQIAKLNPEYLKTLIRKKIIAIAFEFLEDQVGAMPIVRAMSEIAGSTVMLIAAEYLSSENDGKGLILGGVTGVPPSKVVIIGAGTVGEYAARTALGMGAELKVFDKSIYRLRRLKYAINSHQIFTSTLDTMMLSEAISRADVVIGAMRGEGVRSPFIVTEDMVASMKPNSVIVDVSIDQGGCFETSELRTLKSPTFKKFGVIHYCVPNIASRVARTSATALSNILTPYLIEIGETGGIEDMIFANTWFMKGVYAYRGHLTNPYIARKFDIPFKELAFLTAGRML
ncbi:MAG: alanine dehydrogenase [Cytophagales bacterium]|nr:MAG: alanine dehydrogenase [Cytophagales bacterium]